jgi:hypothetical protein
MIEYTKKDLSKLFNIGDSLCTPDVYFDIHTDKDVRIIGGGVWNINKYGNDEKASKTILWAAGESIKGPITKKIDFSKLKYLECSSRDKDLLIDKSKFVPCVSCFNENVIKDPTDSKTLVFTNANIAVSDRIRRNHIENTFFLTNSASLEDFLNKWNVCDKIITNSYHGIYWGLLSGKEVSPFGYSSKFVSVLKLFGFDLPKEQQYDITKRYMLSDMMLHKKKIFFKVKSKDSILNEFREINFEFVNTLKRHEIICKKKQ